MSKAALEIVSSNGIEEERLNSDSSMQDGLVSIQRKLYFKVPDGANPRNYHDIDVYSHPSFPQKYSALNQDPRYKFFGNASISHDIDDGKYFTADLEYTTTDPNATDNENNAVTSDTPPWKLKPQGISFTYPETKVAFEASYNSTGKLYEKTGVDAYGNAVLQPVLPVVNSAGDRFEAERILRNVQLSFSYSVRLWNINNALNYGNTINSKEITICGLKIPPCTALLLTPECEYVTTYQEVASTVKWAYWNVNVNILFDFTGQLLRRKILNVGDRALFPALEFQDELITKKIPLAPEEGASQICRFRKAKKASYTSGTKDVYLPIGDIVYCGWHQFIAIRQAYLSETLNSRTIETYDCQCEQLTQMPLIAYGDKKGQIDEQAIKGEKGYDTLSFYEYPLKSWKALNLPKKGIKWDK